MRHDPSMRACGSGFQQVEEELLQPTPPCQSGELGFQKPWNQSLWDVGKLSLPNFEGSEQMVSQAYDPVGITHRHRAIMPQQFRVRAP